MRRRPVWRPILAAYRMADAVRPFGTEAATRHFRSEDFAAELRGADARTKSYALWLLYRQRAKGREPIADAALVAAHWGTR